MNDNIIEKQKELENWIEIVFKDKREFSDYYQISIDSEIDEVELKRKYWIFLKEISRNPKIKTLDKYLKFLYNSDKFKRIEYVKPFYVKNEDLFNKNFHERMKKISKEITQELQNKED